MRHKSSRAKPTEVTEWNGGVVHRRADDIVTEEPLEIRINGESFSVTMRTPGEDLELAAGFLFTEGIITRRDDIESLTYGDSANVVDVMLAPPHPALSNAPPHRRTSAPSHRTRFVSSACGVCGKASLDEIRRRDVQRITSAITLDAAVLTTLPDKLRHAQAVFDRTGALHAAGLFDVDGNLLLIREDVGRHNAVDKIIGAALLTPPALPAPPARPALSVSVLLVSGRAGFEIAQKAVAAGIPILASVSAPSSLAVQCAREFGLTLVGFLRGDRFVIYAGDKRLVLARR